jgi:hypothetical protein
MYAQNLQVLAHIRLSGKARSACSATDGRIQHNMVADLDLSNPFPYLRYFSGYLVA